MSSFLSFEYSPQTNAQADLHRAEWENATFLRGISIIGLAGRACFTRRAIGAAYLSRFLAVVFFFGILFFQLSSGHGQSHEATGIGFDVPAIVTAFPLPSNHHEFSHCSQTDSAAGPQETPTATTTVKAQAQPGKNVNVGNVFEAQLVSSSNRATGGRATGSLAQQYGLAAQVAGTQRYFISLDTTAVFSSVEEIDSIIFEVYPLSHTWRVEDYAPRSLSATDHEGTISEETRQDVGGGLVGDLTGGIPGYADLKLHLDGGDKSNKTTRQQLKPPHTQVVTSGLSQRGSGAFFKFSRSSEFMIEGGHHLELVFEVPLQWRADLIRVHCRALDREGQTYQKDFLTAVVAHQDAQALMTARTFAQADRLVQSYLRRWQVQRRPKSFLSELEASLTGDQPATPNRSEIAAALISVQEARQIRGFERLPEGMQQSLSQLISQRNKMLNFAR